MARKGVTFDQVANAAATIKARGTEPTIAAIRVELGNEGSYSTISQHLAKWRTEDSEKGVHKEMPPEVENQCMTIVNGIWQMAVREAGIEIAMTRQEASDTKKRLDDQLTGAEGEIKTLEGELAEANRENEALKKKCHQQSEELVALRAELDATKRMQKELSEAIKQQGAPAKRDAGTKPARQPAKAGAPENTQA